MADTNTPNLLLLLPDLTDTFNFAAHVSNNFSTIDSMMGAVQCTSTTRPSNTYAGQIIYETDSKRYVQNTGTKASPVWTYMSHAALAVTAATHPTSGLSNGELIFETDTGLWAIRNGSNWVYPSGQQLYKVTLGTSASSIRLPASGTFPTNFTNLRIILDAKSDGGTAQGYDNANMQFNGVTSGYNWMTWYTVQGAGSVSTAYGTSQSSMQCADVWNAHFAGNGRGKTRIEIPNYTDTSGTKGFTGQSEASDGGTAGVMQLYSGSSSSTSAVGFVTLTMGVGNFVAGTTVTVFGD